MEVEYHNIKGYESYLTDESGLVNGSAEGIFFPINAREVQWIVQQSNEKKIPVTVSAGGTGLTGGRVPLSGWILATDKMTNLSSGEFWLDEETGINYMYRLHGSHLTVPVGLPLKALQRLCRDLGRFYPPDPTERSSYIGGNAATNASGSRSFRYGSTRDWIEAMKVVLPDGQLITLQRGSTITDQIEIGGYKIPLPKSNLSLRKNTAGPVLNQDSDVLDLFIGTSGIFGVITQLTVRTIEPPEIMNIFIYCKQEQAFQIVNHAQQNRDNKKEVPLSVEYLDSRALDMIRLKYKLPPCESLIILELEFFDEEDRESSIAHWLNVLEELGVENTSVAQEPSEIEYHKEMRHAVPETVNALVRKCRQSKLGTDYAVPDDRFQAIMEEGQRKGMQFERKFDLDPGYAIWAHAGDSHFHLNFLPRDREQSLYAQALMVDLMVEVVGSGGTISAEHGLGKKKFKGKPAIVFQFGEQFIEVLHNLRKIMDPVELLNRGNLTGY